MSGSVGRRRCAGRRHRVCTRYCRRDGRRGAEGRRGAVGTHFPDLTHWPAAVAALDGLEGAAWGEAARAGAGERAERIARVCAGQLGLAPLTPPAGAPSAAADPAPPVRAGRDLAAPDRAGRDMPAPDRAALDMAAQFSVDVASVTAEQRAGFEKALGRHAATTAAIIFVMDFVPRTRLALDLLEVPVAAPGEPAPAPPLGDAPSIWSALDEFSRVVARLSALDPVTTELVRLRGARQHDCRLCRSLRSRSALRAGADERAFGAVDHYEDSTCTALEKAALAVTDAVIWMPALVGPTLRRLDRLASHEQCVEVVLDVTRNAANKIAVALGADEPHVTEGTEVYDIDGEGNVVFGPVAH